MPERPAFVHSETDEIHKVSFASVETSPASSNNESDRSDTPPPTSRTSPAMSALPDVPRISAAAFTSLLGALLTDQSTFVAKATEAALVRFLCRLRGKPVPTEATEEPSVADFTFGVTESDPMTASASAAEMRDKQALAAYTFSATAKQVLEDEIICGIVLGLARLDEDDKEATQDDVMTSAMEPTRRRLSPSPDSTAPQADDAHSTAFLGVEEEPIADVWLAGVGGGSDSAVAGDPEQSSTLPQPIPTPSKNADLDSASGDLSFRPESSPLGDPIFSSFSPDPAADNGGEEAAIGKMVAMSLIAAITAADCLEAAVLVEQFLPEVARMADESMFYVRKEAVQALGALAKAVPLEDLQSTVVSGLVDSDSARTT